MVIQIATGENKDWLSSRQNLFTDKTYLRGKVLSQIGHMCWRLPARSGLDFGRINDPSEDLGGYWKPLRLKEFFRKVTFIIYNLITCLISNVWAYSKNGMWSSSSTSTLPRYMYSSIFSNKAESISKAKVGFSVELFFNRDSTYGERAAKIIRWQWKVFMSLVSMVMSTNWPVWNKNIM